MKIEKIPFINFSMLKVVHVCRFLAGGEHCNHVQQEHGPARSNSSSEKQAPYIFIGGFELRGVPGTTFQDDTRDWRL